MDRRFLTLFVLANDASKPRKLNIPFRYLKVAGVLSIVFSLALAFVIIDYMRLRVNHVEFSSLKKENSEQKAVLQGFASKISDLESQLARLNLFDKKIRIIANIEKDPKPAGGAEQVLGMGGDSSVDENTFPSAGAKVDELVEKMRSDLLNLEYQAAQQEESLVELSDHLVNKSVMLASTPSIWPAKGWVTSRFGSRISPFTGAPHHHAGIDIANSIGTPVIAPADGIVVKAAKEANLGRAVVISHGYGIKTTYGHLSETFVAVGQRVKRGAKIGTIGNSGRSTGPHLHYSVSLNGINVNPEKYILD
ncbi:MAG: M23 family metallopeptidase [Deltaproteobacteria bacterium]|nr:M23 family metallopeptidase [Deltaproteobacteria bacterium]MBZ0221224.1 M23 family metallopeptidase [Deltaproteobacteria bacterium]